MTSENVYPEIRGRCLAGHAESIASAEGVCLNGVMPPLGQVIFSRRKAQHLSQAKLSQLASVDRQTISNLETGRTKELRGENYRRIAAALGTTVEELDAAAAGVVAVEVALTIGDKHAMVRSTDRATVDRIADVLGRELGAKVEATATEYGEDGGPLRKLPSGKLTDGWGVLTPAPDQPPAPADSGNIPTPTHHEPASKAGKAARRARPRK